MKTNKTRLAGYVALLMLAGASHAGVMAPIPGDPVTIDSGKVAGTLLASEPVLIMAYRLRPHPYANCDGMSLRR